MGVGSPQMITDYIGGGGSTETPKSDYYVIYGWPLICRETKKEVPIFIAILLHIQMTLSLRWACKIMSWFYIPYQRPKLPSKVCSIKGFVVFFAVLPFAYKLLGSGPCPIWMSISAVMNPIEGPFLAVRGSIHILHIFYTLYILYTSYTLYTVYTLYNIFHFENICNC